MNLTFPEYNLKKAITNNRFLGIWRLSTGFRTIYFFAILFLSISAIAKTSTYLLLRYFADNVLGNPKESHLLFPVALGFVLLAALEGSCTFLSGRLAAKSSEGITLRIRNFLFDHIQKLPFSYHSKTPTGELIQRSTSDVETIRRFFMEQAIGIGRIFLLFTINFTALMRLNIQLALISIATVPLIILTSIFFFRKVSKAYEKYQEQDAILSTTLQENLTGVRVVKAFARQEFEKNKFDRDNREKLKRGIRLLLMHATFWPASDIICGFQMLIGYVIGAIMVINGQLSIGSFMAYLGLIIWLIWPMRNLGRLIVQTSTGLVSFNRVMEVIKQEQEPLDEGDYLPLEGINGAITFTDVSFKYDDENEVLSNISFNVEPGDVIALLGSTGSGKTSLVNLLPRFYEYTSGSILLDGVELNRYPRNFLRRHIGIVEQEPFLFSRSIKENITYGVGRDVSQNEIETAAKAAAIHDVILSFPKGYDTIVGEKGVTLSGGQKQRVTIARTLLKSPKILILDDSTSSVDTETEYEIRKALNLLMSNRTTFIIAHRIQSVMNANLIIVLEKGKIIQRGTHEELIRQEGIYRKIFNIQTKIETELEKEIADISTDISILSPS